MSDFVSRRIAEILDREHIKYEQERMPSLQLSHLKSADGTLVAEVYERLGGENPKHIRGLLLSSYPLVYDKRVLFTHTELSFHRYRASALRSKFYESYTGFKLDTYLRFCRQFEQNCLKGGVRTGVWTSPIAEKHFGVAAEPGDFFGAGSPGWKMNAFSEFLLELLALREGLQPVHFAIYDQLMVNGRLVALGDLLKSPGSEQYTAVLKYLRRRLDLPAPPAEQTV